MKIKYFLLIFVLIAFIILLTGCYDAAGIETLAYAVVIGIDKGSNNNIKLTMQFATLNNSTNSSSTSSQSTSSTTTTVECSTVSSGISLINGYISKQVNLSHCKAIIISEELAKDGIEEQIFTLVNNIEVRPNCNVIISKCDADVFIRNLKLTLEGASTKYYELTKNSSEYTGYIQDVDLSTFYSSILSSTTEAVAILGGINANTAIDTPSETYKASETPIISENSVECMGLAVFQNDKLVGELNNIQTLCHLIVSNKLDEATITIDNPEDINSHISLNILLYKPTKNKVEIINGTPYITSKIYITSTLSSLNKNIDLSNKDFVQAVCNNLSSYLEQSISEYLYTTSQKYKSDIDEFGKYLLPDFLTWNDWIKFNWSKNYEYSFFTVHVSSQIESGYLYDKI